MGNSNTLCCHFSEKKTIKKYNALKQASNFDCVISKESIFDDYILDEKIGKGHFSEVRVGLKKSENNKQYAIKMIAKKRMSQTKRADFLNELGILKRVDHPNIVRLFEVYEDSEYFYLVMEYLSGGTLRSRLEEYVENEFRVKEALYQIFCAVNYLHKSGILHRDLKPENIMIESKLNYQLKIVDFGLAKRFFKLQIQTSFLGTPYFMAPEVIKQKYDEKADIWAVGATAYILFTGYPPIDGRNKLDLYNNIVKTQIGFDEVEWNKHSKDAKTLVKGMLNKNPENRPSAQELLESVYFVSFSNSFSSNFETQVLQNFKRTPKLGKLQETIGKMAIDNISKEELEELTKVFLEVDKKRQGFIGIREFTQTFIEKFGVSVSEAEEIFRNICSKDGKLSYSRFVMVASGMFTDKGKPLLSAVLSKISGNDTPILRKVEFKKTLEKKGRTMKTVDLNRCFNSSQKSTLGLTDIFRITEL